MASERRTSSPSFRHGEPYPRGGTARGAADGRPRGGIADDARREGDERLARAAPLQAGVEGGAGRLVHYAHGLPLAGRRPADLVHGREQAVLGRALEVSGSTGGLVPRLLSRTSRAALVLAGTRIPAAGIANCEGPVMRAMSRDASRPFGAFIELRLDRGIEAGRILETSRRRPERYELRERSTRI